MPIKPENEKLYPGGSTRSTQWLAIRKRILERAGNRCEKCKVANHAVGYRDENGKWHHLFAPGRRIVKIVLTIAHVDHDLANSDDSNLRAWCQQCHNRHDAPHRRANARRTRRKRLADGDMFEGAP